MIRPRGNGHWIIDMESRRGEVFLYHFRRDQSGQVGRRIVAQWSEGLLTEEEAGKLLAAVYDVTQMEPRKPVSFAERVRLAIRRLIDGGLQRAFGSECVVGTKGGKP